jgi:hypothetical protein
MVNDTFSKLGEKFVELIPRLFLFLAVGLVFGGLASVLIQGAGMPVWVLIGAAAMVLAVLDQGKSGGG